MKFIRNDNKIFNLNKLDSVFLSKCHLKFSHIQDNLLDIFLYFSEDENQETVGDHVFFSFVQFLKGDQILFDVNYEIFRAEEKCEAFKLFEPEGKK